MAKRLNYSEEDLEPKCSKRLKLSKKDCKEGEEETEQDVFHLCHFSDDVLLNIFKNVHPLDLIALSKTCRHFRNVCRDRTLWTVVELRRRKISIHELETIVPFLLPTTQKILSKGNLKKSELFTVSPRFVKALADKCPNLKHITLECHQFDATKLTLDCFPQFLEHLSFKGSQLRFLPTEKSYFFGIDKKLPAIKVLDLSYCLWFHPHSLLALSKSHTLSELYLTGCTYVEDYIPYASLASTFGFCSLQVLDLRFTFVNDSDVSCFNRVGSLKELYLEAPSHGRKRISDIGVTSFGSEGLPVINHNRMGLALILLDHPAHNEVAGVGGPIPRKIVSCGLTTITVRNYTSVTDISLKHAAACFPNLKRLDIRDTSCTEQGVERFTECRPDVILFSNYTQTTDPSPMSRSISPPIFHDEDGEDFDSSSTSSSSSSSP